MAITSTRFHRNSIMNTIGSSALLCSSILLLSSYITPCVGFVVIPSSHKAGYGSSATTTTGLRFWNNEHTHQRSTTASGKRLSSLYSSTMGGTSRSRSRSGGSQGDSSDVMYQKVVRPSSTHTQSRLDFLPSLIDYLQNDFRIPSNLPMPYTLKAIDGDGDGEGEGSDDGSSYSIVAIDSPLSRDSRTSRMDVEVVGIYPDDDDNGDQNNNNQNGRSSSAVIPTMVMVVVKQPRLDGDTAGGNGGADIITSRLFEESKKTILKALEYGLNDFMEGRVQSTTRARSVGKNSAAGAVGLGVSSSSSEKADEENQNNAAAEEEEEWNLDDFEGFEEFIERVDNVDNVSSKNNGIGFDTAETPDRKVKQKATTSPPKPPNIELDETGNVVIDAQSTSVIDEPPSKRSPSVTTDATTAVEKDDFAVRAAKKQREAVAAAIETGQSQSKEEMSRPKSDNTDFAVKAAKAIADKKRKEKEDDGDNSSSSGDYAIDAAARIAKVQQKRNNKKESSNSRKEKDVTIIGGSSKGGVRFTPTSTMADNAPYQQSTTSNPTPDNIQEGEAMRLDALPNTIPLGKRDGPGSFRFSISSPSRREARRRLQEKKGRKDGKVAVPNINVDATDAVRSNLTSNKKKSKLAGTKGQGDGTPATATTTTMNTSTSQGTTSTPKDTNKNSKPVTSSMTDKQKKMDINLVRDDDSIDPNLLEEEREQSLDKIAFTKPPSSPRTTAASTANAITDKETTQPPSSPSPPSPPVSKSDAEIEQDIIKAAVEIMPGFLPDEKETISSSKDVEEGSMTPEELLKDVLKFSEDKDKEEEEGAGFVSGAFSKAKELMREEKKQKEKKNDGTKIGLRYQDDDVIGNNDNISPEELELKRIFAAGENIANGRLATNNNAATTTDALTTTTDDEAIDYEASTQALIDADTTVSRNVRTLDEDLAQLEVRISRTPGEDASAAGSEAAGDAIDPLFDVFSGPETYNPNVDPETSVNWPGAAMGTRTDIKMPPELAAAVKNANFAADILSKIAIIDDDNAATNDNDPTKQKTKYSLNGKEISTKQIESLQTCVDEGVKVGLIKDPILYLDERARLSMVVDEMKQQPEERYNEILQNYNDLILCDNFVPLIQHRLRDMYSHIQQYRADPNHTDEDVENLQQSYQTERNILVALVNYAQYLLKQAQALGTDLEATQLSIIRSICVVAMDPKHTTEEQTAQALSDAVRDMRPLLDETFVSYLKYAVAEEEAKLAREGLLDDPDANRWLFVLKIVQQGVYRELEVGIKRYIDHISYVLRMETKEERKQLLAKLIDVMPSMDVRPFVKVVDNIAASLGQSVKGDFDREDAYILGGMANKILQLRKDVETLLPKERLDYMSKDADEWAMRQKEKLLEMKNMTRERLKAARKTDRYEEDDEIPGKFREVERMT